MHLVGRKEESAFEYKRSSIEYPFRAVGTQKRHQK